MILLSVDFESALYTNFNTEAKATKNISFSQALFNWQINYFQQNVLFSIGRVGLFEGLLIDFAASQQRKLTKQMDGFRNLILGE
jgi:hypothetical protein